MPVLTLARYSHPSRSLQISWSLFAPSRTSYSVRSGALRARRVFFIKDEWGKCCSGRYCIQPRDRTPPHALHLLRVFCAHTSRHRACAYPLRFSRVAILRSPMCLSCVPCAILSCTPSAGLGRRCSWLLLVLDRVVCSSRTSVPTVPVVYTGECDLCAKDLTDGATH